VRAYERKALTDETNGEIEMTTADTVIRYDANTDIQEELAYRASQGRYPVLIADIQAQLKELGYELDRRRDCKGNSRYITGPRKGRAFPCTTTGVRERDTKLSVWSPNARRDENFFKLQGIRRNGSPFAVVRGAILEL
jgi:hypothetical protein